MSRIELRNENTKKKIGKFDKPEENSHSKQ